MVDPRIWPDPKLFVPERWIKPYKGVEADRKAFIPFSAGSRNCPGQQYVYPLKLDSTRVAHYIRFAMKNLRLTLAMLLHRYELTLIPGQSHELRVHTVPVSWDGLLSPTLINLPPSVLNQPLPRHILLWNGSGSSRDFIMLDLNLVIEYMIISVPLYKFSGISLLMCSPFYNTGLMGAPDNFSNLFLLTWKHSGKPVSLHFPPSTSLVTPGAQVKIRAMPAIS